MALTARSIDDGTGINVLTDPGATGDMQVAKLAAGVIGSEELIGSLDHGSNQSLYVHPRPDTVIPTAPVSSAGLTTASTAYSIGDVMGSGWTIPNAAKASGGTGRIIAASMSDYADITTNLSLYFSQGSITFGTDNSGPSISDADSLKLVSGPLFLSMLDLGGVRYGSEHSLSIPYVLDGTDLFVYCITNVATSTFFGAVTDLRLRISVIRD